MTRRRFMGRMTACAVAAAVAATIVVAPAKVASASTVNLPLSFCGVGSVGGITVCVQVVGQFVPVGTGAESVVFACTAETQGLVAATGVGCYAKGADGTTVIGAASNFLPGNVSATSGSNTSVPLQSYTVCYGGDYVTLDGFRGSPTGWTVGGCTAPL
jgi:hypothetical protein